MFSLREGAAAPHKLLSCLTGLLTRCTVKLTSPLIHRLSSAEWVPADFPTAGAFVAYRNVVSLLPPVHSLWLYQCKLLPGSVIRGLKILPPCIKHGWERHFDERTSFLWRMLRWVGGQQGWEAVTHRYTKHRAVKVPAGLRRQWPSEVTARSVFHGMILSNPACAPNLCSTSNAPLEECLFLFTQYFLQNTQHKIKTEVISFSPKS